MDIFEQLKRDEGFRQFPYTDTVGKLTIGYGFNLTDRGLTEDDCDGILRRIVQQQVRMDLATSLPFYSTLDVVRQGVLENMCYNIGITRLLGFAKALHAMALGDWNGAATELLASLWSQQVGERAQRLADQLRTGEWY